MTLFEIIILSSIAITSFVLIYLSFSVHTLEKEALFFQQLSHENAKSITNSIGEQIETYNKLSKLADSMISSKETEKMLLDITEKHQNDINDMNGILQEVLCTSKTSTKN